MTKKPTVVDLFAGAGGLSLGLARAGCNVVAAVEIDVEISKSYRANHPGVHLMVEDIRHISGKNILKQTGISSVDIVAGCPPCQGFSKLTDKLHRNDKRNRLLFEMARLVEELRPRICMMENVSGLARRGLPLLRQFERRLEDAGYLITRGVLQMADYGVPQSRKRLVLLAGRGFRIELPAPTHSRNPDSDSNLLPWVTVQEALRGHAEPVPFSTADTRGGPRRVNWNVTRDLKPISIERLRSLSTGANRYSLPKTLRPPCHKHSRGFSNVYGRMAWDTVSPTITSGCLTLSSGRFGHPEKDRTISIREAATLQTFPKSFRFATNIVYKACQMVGNALPCAFAERAAKECLKSLSSGSSGS